MTVEVVVPFRGGCSARERAWHWCRQRLTWPVIEAPGPEPWSKGAAVMPAIERCSADIVVVADADVFTDAIGEAVAAVESGAPWAMPHGDVRRLTQSATDKLLAGANPGDLELVERAYEGMWGGGIVVMPRASAIEIPLDPRFTGWGSEDISWAMALYTLLGDGWRGKAPLYHLWHPPQERMTRKRGSVASDQLRRRYARARRDPNEMRSLIEEGRHALHPSEPAVHTDPPVRV